jgi:hypothetical protein
MSDIESEQQEKQNLAEEKSEEVQSEEVFIIIN